MRTCTSVAADDGHPTIRSTGIVETGAIIWDFPEKRFGATDITKHNIDFVENHMMVPTHTNLRMGKSRVGANTHKLGNGKMGSSQLLEIGCSLSGNNE